MDQIIDKRIFGNIRPQTIKVVSTFDLMMACAKHHNLTGELFKKKITDHWHVLDKVHSALLNDHIMAEREAAAFHLATVIGAVDLNLYAFFAAKELGNGDRERGMLSWWFKDMYESTKFRDETHPLHDCFVIVKKLPNERDTGGLTLG